MLRIVVGIKWVPNTTSVNIDPKTGTLIREGIPSVVNPHDLEAVEMALRLRDEYGGRVTAITMSPPSARAGLEHVLGMGVDDAVLVSDRAFAGADTLATSYVLAKVIERLGYDLIVFGQETIDSSTAHVGAQVASWLDIPYVYYVTHARLEGGRLIVRRSLENVRETYELELPALISVAMHTLHPRRVRLSHKLRAKLESPIETWTNRELGLEPDCIGLKGSPTALSKIEMIPKVPRKNEIFRGDPREAAKWLVDKLIEEGLLEV